MASVESSRPGPADAVVEADARRYLWGTATRVLSGREASALWLHYGEGLPARDVATILGRSHIVVKAMIFRTERLVPLLGELAPEGIGPDRKAPAHGTAPVAHGG